MFTTQFRWVRVWIALVFIMSAVLISSPTDQVFAGSNGQQLTGKLGSLDSKYVNAYIRVCGTNQNGTMVCWPSANGAKPVVQPDPVYRWISTNGWWWAGTASIQWKDGNTWKTVCTVNVPKKQSSDWYSFGTCR
jgi:hypothetical protein